MDNAQENLWQDYALCYDSLNHLTPYKKMLRAVVSQIPQGSKQVLDAACGTGNLENTIKEMCGVPSFKVSGVDASEEMLSRANNKGSANSEFSFADLNNPLPFEDEGFDCVVSVNTLYAIKDPGKLLTELNRVLRRSGKLIIVTPKFGCQNGIILKEHSGSTKPDEYWFDAHSSSEREEALIREAISDPEVIEKMLKVGMYNRRICSRVTFHFFHKQALLDLVLLSGFSEIEMTDTYANQAFLLTATKN